MPGRTSSVRSPQGGGLTAETAVNAELPPLKLERALFSVAIDSNPDAAGPEGHDRVEFWCAPIPARDPAP